MSKLTQKVAVDVEITPRELASAFCEMHDGEQAEFFAHVWKIAKTWRAAGFCRQSHGICNRLDSDGLNALETLASHLPAEILHRMSENAA